MTNNFLLSPDAIAVRNSGFGDGDGLVLLQGLGCTGTEEALAACPPQGNAIFSLFFCCFDDPNAGVICIGELCPPPGNESVGEGSFD